jgi:hypothetical protein
MLVAGCDQLFQLDPIGPVGSGDAGTSDAGGEDRTDVPQVTNLKISPHPLVGLASALSFDLAGTRRHEVYFRVFISPGSTIAQGSEPLDENGAGPVSVPWSPAVRGLTAITVHASYNPSLMPAATLLGELSVFEVAGTYGPLSETLTVPGDVVFATLVAVPQNSEIRRLGLVTSGPATLRLGLYADGGGVPTTLLAESAPLTSNAGRIEVDFATTNSPSVVWIAFLCQTQCAVSGSTLGTNPPPSSGSAAFGNGLPSAFPAANDYSGAFAVYLLVD